MVGILLKPKYEGKQNGSINWIIRHVIQQIRASEKAQLMPRYNIDKFSSKINIEMQRRQKLKTKQSQIKSSKGLITSLQLQWQLYNHVQLEKLKATKYDIS